MLSHGFWQREFGGDPSVLSRTVVARRPRVQVIGVTPPEFFGVRVGFALRRDDPARQRADHPRRGKLARSAQQLVAEPVRPARARPDRRHRRKRACAPCSRSCARPRCRKTGGRRIKRRTSTIRSALLPRGDRHLEPARRAIAARSTSCSASSDSCSRSRARTWRTCCSRNRWRGGASWRCGCRSARAAASWCGSCWSKASCCR